MVMKLHRHLKSPSIFDLCLYVLLGLFTLLCLVPMLYVVSVSLTPYGEVLKNGGFVIIPSSIDVSAYRTMLGNGNLINAYKVSFFITIVGTILNLVLTIAIGYPISQKDLPGSKGVSLFVLFTMLFNGGMIPTYLIVKSFGLIDSIWSLIIPQAIMPYNVFLMRSFFSSLPSELYEAADIDGAGEFRVMVQIAVPLSKPMIMTNLLFYAVIRWNTYMSAILYITDPSLRPLQVVLREILIGADAAIEQAEYSTPTQSLKMAAVVLTALPVTIVYPFVQKHFTKGMMLGAIKG